eukprot:1194978-Prorocentrum_minimum.AAC.7
MREQTRVEKYEGRPSHTAQRDRNDSRGVLTAFLVKANSGCGAQATRLSIGERDPQEPSPQPVMLNEGGRVDALGSRSKSGGSSVEQVHV